ncbi:hypothetical protein FD754_004771 [Muntiacus muntjak]|uniref:Catenin alpha-2 n=1 Tax=Muntiacus muntjak TaxID=9888 RepID=A0A5N3WIR1_MUNMU|nr:hypothetical protein FD754_004771 [Muntiacus muntjak]
MTSLCFPLLGSLCANMYQSIVVGLYSPLPPAPLWFPYITHVCAQSCPTLWDPRLYTVSCQKPTSLVNTTGETMRIASSEFADDPCSSVKRGTMVRAARALLSAVTRLLILADMADVMRLLSHLKIELKDPHCRDEMAAARGALKKNATMLYTASQAFLRHPDVAATRANRDYVFKQVQEAIAGISNAAQATSPTDEAKGHTGIGELAAALNEFDTLNDKIQCNRNSQEKSQLLNSLSESRLAVSGSVTPWAVDCQAPLAMKFSRREYCSGFPFPSPGDLPDPVIEPRYPTLQADSLPSEPLGKPLQGISFPFW